MEKTLRSISKKHSINQVFNDFLEISALSISNSINFVNRKNREKRYLEIVGKYTKDELNLFCKAFALLSEELEKEPKDILGELLMKIQEGDSRKGQYLTPNHICKLNAILSIDEEKLKDKNVIELNEPSCGGGSLIIALYNVIKEKGYNPQQKLKVIAKDIDTKSVYMCYIQLTLLGVAAKVIHSNSISGEIYDIWLTPQWIQKLY